ncbi:hypothetical protein F4808DRAFT_474275, partial [Astrocystis sublimbata]
KLSASSYNYQLCRSASGLVISAPIHPSNITCSQRFCLPTMPPLSETDVHIVDSPPPSYDESQNTVANVPGSTQSRLLLSSNGSPAVLNAATAQQLAAYHEDWAATRRALGRTQPAMDILPAGEAMGQHQSGPPAYADTRTHHHYRSSHRVEFWRNMKRSTAHRLASTGKALKYPVRWVGRVGYIVLHLLYVLVKGAFECVVGSWLILDLLVLPGLIEDWN